MIYFKIQDFFLDFLVFCSNVHGLIANVCVSGFVCVCLNVYVCACVYISKKHTCKNSAGIHIPILFIHIFFNFFCKRKWSLSFVTHSKSSDNLDCISILLFLFIIILFQTTSRVIVIDTNY